MHIMRFGEEPEEAVIGPSNYATRNFFRPIHHHANCSKVMKNERKLLNEQSLIERMQNSFLSIGSDDEAKTVN